MAEEDTAKAGRGEDGADAHLRERVEELERRMRSLEAALLRRESLHDTPVRPADIGPVPVATTPPVQVPVAPPVAPPPLPTEAQTWRRAADFGGRLLREGGLGARAREGATFEAVIGKNWTSWVGGIVVVLGVFFFMKYAWDRGWLVLSPGARVWSAIAAGAAAIGGGLVMNRRTMRVLSATLMGLGVAVVMAACFAGHVMFEPAVFSRGAALFGVVVAAGAGIGLGWRFNVMTLAIIALVGAYLAPLVLGGTEDQSLALMGYLGAVAGVGWALAYLRPRWGAVRVLVWVCTVLWMVVWMLSFGHRDEHRALAIGAIGFFYLGFLAASFFSLHRAFRLKYEPVGDEYPEPGHARQLDGMLAILSMLSTGAAFAGLYVVLDDVGSPRSGLFAMHPSAAAAIGLACVQAMVAFATPARQFMWSGIIQAGALVTLAIPLALGRFAITVAWLVLAGGLAGLSWRMRHNRAIKGWAVALVGLAVARVFTFDLFDAGLRTVWGEPFGQRVTPWLVLALGTAIFAHGVAWVVGDGEVNADRAERSVAGAAKRTGIVLAVLGTASFVAAGAIVWSGDALTLLWCAGLAVLVGLSRRGERLGYGAQAVIVAAVAGGKWLLVDGLSRVWSQWSSAGESAAPVFNSFALAGAVLIGLVAWLGWRPRSEEGREAAAVALIALVFAWLNFETLRFVDWMGSAFADVGKAKQVALSVLWGLVGLASVIVGFARHVRPLRYAALGLLGVTLLKILLIDMAQVQAVYRILSFVAVGVLLLCVSYVYHRAESAGKEDRATETR